MPSGASDRYTDTDTHVIKKRAGRRPALTNTREAQDDNSFNHMTSGASDRYTDTDTHVIKKRAGRRPALTKTRER